MHGKVWFALLLPVIFTFCSAMEASTAAAGPPYVLKAKEADLSKAPDVIVEGSPPNLGGWRVSNRVSFSVDLKQPGGYTVFLDYSKEESVGDDANLRIIFENAASGSSMSVTAPLPSTGRDWSNYSHHKLCSVWPLEAGKTTVRLESANPVGNGYVMNLRSITLATGGDEGALAPTVTKATDTPPAGFIALAPDTMNWSEAKAYCQQLGGKLPLIGGSSSLGSVPSKGTSIEGTSIDGFGTVGGPWPADLPSGRYWTGTANSDFTGYSWCVGGYGGVSVTGYPQSFTYRAACVP